MPPAPRRSMLHTLKSHRSTSLGFSRSLVAFWMLRLGSAPALQRRAVGSTLCPPAGTHEGQGAACPAPTHPGAAHFTLGQAWRTGGMPRLPQSDACSTLPEDGKSVARRFWSQSHAGCSCESKTMFPKASTMRLSP